MLKLIDTQKILFLDIETVPEKATFDELSETEKELLRPKPNTNAPKTKARHPFTKGLEYGPSLVKSFVYLWVFLT